MRIAVIAPSRNLPRAAADRLAEMQQQHPDLRGVSVTIHEQCFLEHGHFAGDDDTRAAAFIDVANDPDIDAVWFARGGYGAGRLLPLVLPALRAPAARKIYIGYSDTGYLLAALAHMGVGQSVHGPLVSDGLRPGGEDALARALRWLTVKDENVVEPSLASGERAYAFNLTILASLAATDHLPSLDGSVLMIEEVGEHLYAVDRHLMTAFSSGRLDRLRGVRCGRISDVPENDIAFGHDAEEIVRYWCDRHGVPYLGPANIGHDAQNRIVPFPIAFKQAVLP
ncbi:MAG: LD-carboxypeptidase [Pseudomonadota bacterium]